MAAVVFRQTALRFTGRGARLERKCAMAKTPMIAHMK
jgi:hypothetical protein